MINKEQKIILTALSILAVFTFFVGMHTADNCVNLMKLNCELKGQNIAYGENNFFLHNATPEQCYSVGLYLMMVSSLFLGYVAIMGAAA